MFARVCLAGLTRTREEDNGNVFYAPYPDEESQQQRMMAEWTPMVMPNLRNITQEQLCQCISNQLVSFRRTIQEDALVLKAHWALHGIPGVDYLSLVDHVHDHVSDCVERIASGDEAVSDEDTANWPSDEEAYDE